MLRRAYPTTWALLCWLLLHFDQEDLGRLCEKFSICICLDESVLVERFGDRFYDIALISRSIFRQQHYQLALRNHMMLVNDVLGGAFATIGKSSYRHANVAGNLALVQIRFSQELGDRYQVKKYMLYLAESLFHLGNRAAALQVIRRIGNVPRGLESLLGSVMAKITAVQSSSPDSCNS